MTAAGSTGGGAASAATSTTSAAEATAARAFGSAEARTSAPGTHAQNPSPPEAYAKPPTRVATTSALSVRAAGVTRQD